MKDVVGSFYFILEFGGKYSGWTSYRTQDGNYCLCLLRLRLSDKKEKQREVKGAMEYLIDVRD